jgi:group I intron endonuclease
MRIASGGIVPKTHFPRTTYIYAITHDASGKAYIGSTWSYKLRWIDHRRRLSQGIHHCVYLQRAWTKYGLEAFSFVLLDAKDVETAAERLALEREWITKAPRYNTVGISEDGTSFSLSEATRAKLRALNLGKKQSKESKLKRSLATKGRKRNPEASAKTAEFWTGRKHSEEAKARMSASAKARKKTDRPGYWAGKTRPQDTKAKMTASQIARWASRREVAGQENHQMALPLHSHS